MPQSIDTASILSGNTTGTARALSRANVFSLDTFSSPDFIVKDFVESLSEAAAPASRKSQPASAVNASNQPFDPKPLIRAFEQALNSLKNLSEDLELRENELSASVRRAEAAHNQNVRARERELEQATSSFRELERSLDSDYEAGGNAAVRIGERLEELDKQRQKAQDAKFIVQCWLEVSNRGDLSSLEDVRRSGGGEGKVRCALIARQLLKISQRLQPSTNGIDINGVNGHGDDSGHRTQPKEVIEKFLEALEKDLLKQFDDSYRRQNFDGMKECAAALRDFNDGASVMGSFVNQHQFFIDRSQLVTEEISSDTELWDRLADPDAEPPGIEPTLQSLLDEVKLVAQEESFIIKRAFPYYDEVLGRFVGRVFQQSVQQKLEQVLDKAGSVSALAFLRSLQSSKSYVSALVEDLKLHGLTEHPEPASAMTAALLDQQMDDLFVPYFAGSSYIEREKRSLEELYSSLLFKFTTYHSRRKKVPTSYLGSLQARSKEMMHSAREAYLDRLDSAELSSSQKTMLTRLAGISSNTNKNEIEVTDEDGELSLPYVKRMLKWLAESVGRGLELAGGHETPKDVRELLHLLISNTGEIYLETALDAQIEAAGMQESTKNEPEFAYLHSLQASISILHLLIVTIHTLLIPLVATNLTIRRDLEKTTNLFVERIEAKIDTVLQKTLDSALSWTGKLLGQQKKTDFRPKDESSLNLDQLQTSTCLATFAFLSKLHKLSTASLSGKVLSGFTLELALGLRSLLFAHFRSFQVSQTGGVMVTQDMTKYVELLKSFNPPESFNSSIEVLTEIPNLFTLRAEALRERLRGIGTQALVSIERSDLKPFVQRREDANSVAVQSALNSL